MFAFSINLDIDKLKEAVADEKKKKKGSRKTRKTAEAAKAEPAQTRTSKNS